MTVAAGMLIVAMPAAALLGAVLFALAARELIYQLAQRISGSSA